MTSEQNSATDEPEGAADGNDTTPIESDTADTVVKEPETAVNDTESEGIDTDSPDAAASESKADRKAARKAEKAAARSGRSGGSAPGESRHWLASLLLSTGVAALAAAVACLGYFGYVGIHAYLSDDGSITALRDDSVDAAEQAVVNVTTIDPNDLDGWDKRVKDTLTGDALKQANGSDLRKMVEQAKQASNGSAGFTITSRITGAAPTEVDLGGDTAKVLVFGIATQAIKANNQQQAKPIAFLVTVVKADGKRKASVMVPLDGIQYSDDGSQGGGN